MLWDVGGVLLTNGWDRNIRARASRELGFDRAEFEKRHSEIFDDLEAGRLSLDEYIDWTLFQKPRAFDRETVRRYILDCSSSQPATLELAKAFARSSKVLMCTLNNESRQLNAHRIAVFG